jgi:hypothetical protein
MCNTVDSRIILTNPWSAHHGCVIDDWDAT